MITGHLFDAIESERFKGRANLASDFATFVYALREQEEMTALTRALASSHVRGEVLGRIQRLASSVIDPRYENPWDVALATYVLALTSVDFRLGIVAANAARQAGQTWWLRQTIERVSSAPEFAARTSSGPLPASSQRRTTSRDRLIEADPFMTASPRVLVSPLPDKAWHVSRERAA